MDRLQLYASNFSLVGRSGFMLVAGLVFLVIVLIGVAIHAATRSCEGRINTLLVGQEMKQGDIVGDEMLRLDLQYDGNLVLYQREKHVWSSHTNGKPVTSAVLKSNGRISLFDSHGVLLFSDFIDNNKPKEGDEISGIKLKRGKFKLLN